MPSKQRKDETPEEFRERNRLYMKEYMREYRKKQKEKAKKSEQQKKKKERNRQNYLKRKERKAAAMNRKIQQAATEEAAKASPFQVDPEKDVSYINLTLLDASKTIETSVKEMLSERLPKVRFPVAKRFLSKERVQDKLAAVAAKKVKPSLIAKQLQDQMPKLLMYTMHQKMGMKVAARTVFCEGAYLVIEFQVKHVDSQKLLAKIQEGVPADGGTDDLDMEVPAEVLDAWMNEMEQEALEGPLLKEGPEPEPPADTSATSNGWTWSGWIAAQSEYVITKLLPDDYKQGLEQDTMPPLVQTKITEEMGAMMQTKMEQKHLVSEIAVLPAAAQARYFFANLEAVREHKE